MRAVKKKENPLKGEIILGDNACFLEENLQIAKAKEVEEREEIPDIIYTDIKIQRKFIPADTRNDRYA